jgi:5S rRNA maturation endonuclease (ribonuclease M5)
MSKSRDAAVTRFLGLLKGVRRNGDRYSALCPAHDDHNPSLSIREADGKILVKCFSGCTAEGVCKALGIEIADLFSHDRSVKRIVAEYSYCSEIGEVLYQNVRYDPKDFRLRKPNGKGGWTWKLGEIPRVLYNLPELRAAKDVLIVEGEKDAETGKKIGLTSTTSGGVGSWKDEFSVIFCGKRVVIIADADEPGRRHAQKVARSVYGNAKSLKLVELPNAKDLTEWVQRGGRRGDLSQLIECTPTWAPRIMAGAKILDDLVAYIRRFVSLSEVQATVIAVWVCHTYVFSAAFATPYLAITSAEKQSGKTRLLEVLETIVSKPWFTGKVTPAVLIRKIDAEQPTLLLDESDAAFGGDKEYAETLRGVLNTGHRRGGKSSCCVGSSANISTRDFSTFSPKAIAGIGKLPDTVADRAIPIRLKRAAPGERVERFRLRDIDSEAARLREDIREWCVSIEQTVSDAVPALPDSLTDRQQDGAEPLIAIADAAGGTWSQIVRAALVQLCAEGQASDESIGKLLLSDILQVFQTKGVDRLPSAALTRELTKNESSPWGEWSRGNPLTPIGLAQLLKPFGVVPHSIRIGNKTPKGYEKGDFRDAFRRYLPAEPTSFTPSSPCRSATPQQANTEAASSASTSRNARSSVAAPECEKPNPHAACCGVATLDFTEDQEEKEVEEDL